MDFQHQRAREILERTPATLRALLQDLPAEWTSSNEGDGTWSPHEVVAHLIHDARALARLELGEKQLDNSSAF
jgi:hypothetical protein